MKYLRASRKQLDYIWTLAERLSYDLPWGWEGYSMNEANKMIARLQRLKKQRDRQAEEERQTRLL